MDEPGRAKTCTEVGELVAWNGPPRLSPGDRAGLADHLADCERCSAQVGRLWGWLLGPWPLPAPRGAFTLQRDSGWKVFTAGFLCAVAVAVLLLVGLVDTDRRPALVIPSDWLGERAADGWMLEALAEQVLGNEPGTSLPGHVESWLQGWNGAVASRDAQALQARLAPGF
jgi:hypothetical protein